MILYFSSTGNCKYAAEQIAARTGDQVMSITDAWQSENFSIRPEKGESLGFVLPTYFGVLPTIVAEFLEKAELRLTEGSYVYTVDTYGFHYGNVAAELAKILRGKTGREQDADFLLQSVDNWVPNFDLTDETYVQSALDKADEALGGIIEDIVQKSASGSRASGPHPCS